MNILRLIETEFQGETNPGNYMGPDIDAFGIVTANDDETTHTPESDKERKKRKKEKQDMETVSDSESVAESKKDDFLDELMEDPRIREMLTRMLSNIKMSPVHESKEAALSAYVDALLEESTLPPGSIGPATSAEWKELSSFDFKDVQKGIEVESEHTPNKAVAAKIALAHFKEDPNYYTKLDRIEGKEPYVKTS